MDIDDIITLPDQSFRLPFPKKFNRKGLLSQKCMLLTSEDFWEFVSDPDETEENLLRSSQSTAILSPKIKKFCQEIQHNG